MSGRRRQVLLAILVVAFAGLALAINALLADGDRAPTPARPDALEHDEAAGGAGAPSRAEAPEPPMAGRERPGRIRRAEMAAREPPPPERTIERRDRAVLEAAEPVARRFLRAFARYEVGGLGAETQAALRGTATHELFTDLVSRPPRPTTGVRPERALVVGAFELVPVAADLYGRQLVEVELVGTLRRSGDRTPIGVRMYAEEGRWRVGGLTR